MAEQTAQHDRRYIGTKEVLAYSVFDSSRSMSIEGYRTRFMLDLVKIDLAWGAAAGFVVGIWDIINDSFAGVIIDKTRTRWGKFKPYLMAFAIPGTILAIFSWLTPYFFDRNPYNVKKLIYHMFMGMSIDLTSTFRGFADTGFVASMSPNPKDRVMLFTLAELISALWESFPSIIMGLLIDLINHNIIGISMPFAYLSMGTFCAVFSGAAAFVLTLVSKERVSQNVETTNMRDGFRAMLKNRPLLIIALNDIAKIFTLNTGEENYFTDVLGSISIKNVIILPGAPLSIMSYSYIAWAQKKFSTKALWIFGDLQKNLTDLLVFFIGIIGGTGKKGFYNRIGIMIAAFTLKDVLYKSTLSIFKIVPRMMLTEALDYGEWKNGFRSEGTSIAAMQIIKKITGVMVGPFRNLIMLRIGYSLQAGFGQQTARTKFLLFACCTLLPGLTGLLSVIPKLFYQGSHATRERMYEELSQMRALKQENYYKEQEDLDAAAQDYSG